jgi:DNA primase
MRIPDEKIEEIRSSSDIVEVISSFVNLKKRGKNYLGLCPFHQEKTPSFTVSSDKQVYHCFGCGAGGNVFTFIMEQEKVSFIEAVRNLAEKAGIQLAPEGRSEQVTTDEAETEMLYAVNRFTGLHFHKNLTSTKEGRVALDYFHRRNWSDETIKTFGLGYSLDSPDALIRHARENKISIESLIQCGLVVKRDDGSCYDRFRGRTMFPVLSASGRVLGFGGRRMTEDETSPKYMNSPETKIYNKSRILYGLYQAKDALRQEDNAVLVEGYADLLSVYQSGLQNVVASSGTALTEEQIRLVSRYTKNITVVYDADSAGSKATIRGVDLILEQGPNVRVVELPQGEDPDSYVNKHGGEKFRKLVDKSVSFVEFTARAFEKQGKLDTPEGQTEVVRSVIETIAKIGDPLKREFYIKEISEKYKIYESVLHRELEKQLRVNRPWPKRQKLNDGAGVLKRTSKSARGGEIGAEGLESKYEITAGQPEMPIAERDLIKLMLERGIGLVDYVFANVGIDDFQDERARTIAGLILDRCKVKGKIDANTLINETADTAIRSLVTDLLLRKYEVSKEWRDLEIELDDASIIKMADDAIGVIKMRDIEKRIEENQMALKNAIAENEDVTIYLEKHVQLLEQKRLLQIKPDLHKAKNFSLK